MTHQIRATATLKNGERLVQNVATRGLSHPEAVDVDVIQVTAVVTSNDGRFVPRLTQRDFRVLEDDRPQPITSFASEDIPLELVTAIDVSSSMEEALPHVRTAAKTFLAGLAAHGQGHGPELQRQHLHSGAPQNRPGGAGAGDRSHGGRGGAQPCTT